MNKAGQRKLDLIRERGPLCEYCRMKQATQAHHCLFSRRKGTPEFDVRENLMLLCDECHKYAGFALKRAFWAIQVERYGLTHMRGWITRLPIKYKENFE